MQGVKVTLVVDLYRKPKSRRARVVQDEIIQLLREEAAKSYSHPIYQGKHLREIGGSLVEMNFADYGTVDHSWQLFGGLSVVQVRVSEEGSDHFPAAGMYHFSSLTRNDVRGVSATVRYGSKIEYPAREELIESIVKTHYSERLADVQINLPVTVARTWSLTLVAPTLQRAQRGYELLRGGLWAPQTPFADAMPDNRKVRQIPVRYETTYADD